MGVVRVLWELDRLDRSGVELGVNCSWIVELTLFGFTSGVMTFSDKVRPDFFTMLTTSSWVLYVTLLLLTFGYKLNIEGSLDVTKFKLC